MKLWNRNFIMIVLGQIASLFANNILHFALSLHVWHLTGSGTLFGALTAVSMIPTILLMPVGGVLADRINKRNLMVFMDLMTALITAATALTVGLGRPLTVITSALIFLSVVEAFYTPCVQASIPALQEKGNLIRANAVVNQISMFSNITGPVLGGVLYGFVGLGPILVVSFSFFLISGLMEIFIRIPFTPQETSYANPFRTMVMDSRQCIAFLRKEQRDFLRLLPAIAALNFALTAIASLGLLFMVESFLGLSSQWYGFAAGCVAASGLLGGFLTAVLAGRYPTKKLYLLLIFAGIALLPIALISVLRANIVLLYVLLVVSYMAEQLFSVMFNIHMVSVIQSKTPQHLLGKLMAFITTLAIVAEPLGRVLYGFLFDFAQHHVYGIFLFTALFTIAVGLSTRTPIRKIASPAEQC